MSTQQNPLYYISRFHLAHLRRSLKARKYQLVKPKATEGSATETSGVVDYPPLKRANRLESRLESASLVVPSIVPTSPPPPVSFSLDFQPPAAAETPFGPSLVPALGPTTPTEAEADAVSSAVAALLAGFSPEVGLALLARAEAKINARLPQRQKHDGL